MYENPYATSLDTRILSATPMELVKMLYQAAIEAVQAARQHLTRGEIAQRGRSVSRAVELLTELSGSLDHAKGGELSGRLAALYDYMQRTLLDANFRQGDDGLAKVEGLLRTLNEAWSAIDAPRPAIVPLPGRAMESYPASYPLGGAMGMTEEYSPRIANQWCA